MIEDIVLTIWIFLPAGLANMAPIFAAHWNLWPQLDRPIDGGKTWRGRRLFGEHKTIRGFVAGWLSALALVLLQIWLSGISPTLHDFSSNVLDFSQLNPLIWASALSI